MTTLRGLAIGIGNPLRSDDGVGCRVVEGLGVRFGWRTEIVHQLTPELVEFFRGIDRVAFVDAAVDELPGRVASRDVVPAPATLGASHRMSPGELLGLSAWLGIDPAPRGRLFTIGAQRLEHGDELSPIVSRAVEPAIEGVAAWLRTTCVAAT